METQELKVWFREDGSEDEEERPERPEESVDRDALFAVVFSGLCGIAYWALGFGFIAMFGLLSGL